MNCINVCMFACSLRCILLAYIKESWMVLPTQLLNGFTFALFWVGAAEYTDSIAPKEVHTTMFSIVASAYFNIGGLVGNIGGGQIYSYYGGHMLFLSFGFALGAWAVVLGVYSLARRACKKMDLEEENDNSIA